MSKNVIQLDQAKANYQYQALIRGYEEVFESKLLELKDKHPHEILSFAQMLEEAQDFIAEVNVKKGWSQASKADVRELEKLCTEMDDILHTYARFLDRRKIIDVGQRILNQEYLGQAKEESEPLSFEQARQRRAGGIR